MRIRFDRLDGYKVILIHGNASSRNSFYQLLNGSATIVRRDLDTLISRSKLFLVAIALCKLYMIIEK